MVEGFWRWTADVLLNTQPGHAIDFGGFNMDSEQIIRMKAQAFDRIVQAYRQLEQGSGFAMSSWVIFGETLESEIKKIKNAEAADARS